MEVLLREFAAEAKDESGKKMEDSRQLAQDNLDRAGEGADRAEGSDQVDS